MVWEHSGRMHWTSHDVDGLMLDIRIVKGTTVFQVIDAETGEITKTTEYSHPKDAMEVAKEMLRANQEIAKTSTSAGTASAAEASGAV